MLSRVKSDELYRKRHITTFDVRQYTHLGLISDGSRDLLPYRKIAPTKNRVGKSAVLMKIVYLSRIS